MTTMVTAVEDSGGTSGDLEGRCGDEHGELEKRDYDDPMAMQAFKNVKFNNKRNQGTQTEPNGRALEL